MTSIAAAKTMRGTRYSGSRTKCRFIRYPLSLNRGDSDPAGWVPRWVPRWRFGLLQRGALISYQLFQFLARSQVFADKAGKIRGITIAGEDATHTARSTHATRSRRRPPMPPNPPPRPALPAPPRPPPGPPRPGSLDASATDAVSFVCCSFVRIFEAHRPLVSGTQPDHRFAPSIRLNVWAIVAGMTSPGRGGVKPPGPAAWRHKAASRRWI